MMESRSMFLVLCFLGECLATGAAPSALGRATGSMKVPRGVLCCPRPQGGPAAAELKWLSPLFSSGHRATLPTSLRGDWRERTVLRAPILARPGPLPSARGMAGNCTSGDKALALRKLEAC